MGIQVCLVRNHSCSMFARFSKKLIFLTLWYAHVPLIRTHTYMCVSGGKNVSFSENFAYVPNEWSWGWLNLDLERLLIILERIRLYENVPHWVDVFSKRVLINSSRSENCFSLCGLSKQHCKYLDICLLMHIKVCSICQECRMTYHLMT